VNIEFSHAAIQNKNTFGFILKTLKVYWITVGLFLHINMKYFAHEHEQNLTSGTWIKSETIKGYMATVQPEYHILKKSDITVFVMKV
jgi:hypothetical protein